MAFFWRIFDAKKHFYYQYKVSPPPISIWSKKSAPHPKYQIGNPEALPWKFCKQVLLSIIVNFFLPCYFLWITSFLTSFPFIAFIMDNFLRVFLDESLHWGSPHVMRVHYLTPTFRGQAFTINNCLMFSLNRQITPTLI